MAPIKMITTISTPNTDSGNANALGSPLALDLEDWEQTEYVEEEQDQDREHDNVRSRWPQLIDIVASSDSSGRGDSIVEGPAKAQPVPRLVHLAPVLGARQNIARGQRPR